MNQARRILMVCWAGLAVAATGEDGPSNELAGAAKTVGWATNGPAVYCSVRSPATNQAAGNRFPARDQLVFDHYLAGTLNNLVWTNFIAHTNGRNIAIWSARSHPAGWPTNRVVAAWNTNCLMWGMKGLTALSPCWEGEGNSGQVPVTALTRRHGYSRGHGMGSDGFTTNFAGRKVWFLSTNNTLVEVMVVRNVVRTPHDLKRDYTLFLFDRDVPMPIEPMRVVAATNLAVKYPACRDAPRPIFKTEQQGQVSAEVNGFQINTWKGGDSGSPDMLPLPGELVFFGGRSTSGPSAEMQSDMDALCRLEGLNPKNYQMRWVNLAGYPSYRDR